MSCHLGVVLLDIVQLGVVVLLVVVVVVVIVIVVVVDGISLVFLFFAVIVDGFF